MAAELPVSLVMRLVNRVTQPLRQVTRDFEGFRKGVERANKHFETAAKLQLASEAVNQFGRAARAAIQGPLAVAQGFEKAMTEVRLRTGATAEEFEALNDMAKELGATTKFTGEEAANAMTMLGIAGLDASEVMAAMPDLLAAATASGTELAQTADMLMGIRSGFDLEATDVGRISDVMAYAAGNAKTNMQDLSAALSYVSTNAKDLNVSFEETTAMVALLQDAQIDGTRAGTALNAILSRLSAPAGEAKETLKALGVETLDAAGNLRKPQAILGDLQAAMERLNLGTGQQGEILTRLFGQEAVAGARALMRVVSSGELEDLVGEMGNAEGATQKLAKEMMDNLAGAATQLSSAIDGLKNALGTPLLDDVKALWQWLSKVVSATTEWVEEHPTAAKWIGRIGGGIALLVTVLGGLTLTLSVLATALGYLNIAFGGAGDGTKLLGKGLRGFVLGVKMAVVWTFKLAFRALSALWSALVWTATTLVRTVVPAVVSFVASLIRLSITLVTRAAIAVASFVAGLVTMALTTVATMIPAIVSATAAFWGFAVAVMATPVGWIAAAVAVVAGLAYLIYDNWDAIAAFFKDVLAGVKAAFAAAVEYLQGAWSGLAEFFSGLWDGIKETFRSALDWILEKLKPVLGLIEKVRGFLPEALGGAAEIQTNLTLGAEASAVERTPGQAEVGGTIQIVVDSEGRPRVRRLEAEGGIDLDVNAGLAMVAP